MVTVVDQPSIRQAVIELVDDMILTLDDEGRITSLNPAAERAFGHDRKHARGLRVESLLPALTRAARERHARDCREPCAGHAFDARRADHERFPVTVRLKKVELPAEQGCAVVVVASRRNGNSESLHESEQRLKAVVDNTTAVIYIKDVEGRYQLINRRFEELFDVVDAEVRGKTDHDIFPPAIADAFRRNDVAVLEAGAALEFDEVAPHADGGHTYISVKFPLLRPSGDVYAVCGISTDITARKQAESKLTAAKQELERLVDERTADLTEANRRLKIQAAHRDRVVNEITGLVETANEGIWTIDVETKTTFANRRMADMLGYSVEELMGRPVSDFVREDLHSDLAEQLARRAQGTSEQMDLELRRKDGSPLWVILALSPMRDESGNVVGALGMLTDITSRKHAEEHQKLLLLELDHRVKNVLGTVLALGDLTARNAASIGEYRQTFTGRLRVLARTHEALARASWRELALDEVVRLVLAPHRAASEARFRARGDAVRVAARATTPLALALNELGTNALKYGALSCAAGRVDLTWRRAHDGAFELSWSEAAGPAVKAPASDGTGLGLIRRLIEYELDGSIDIAFPASGFTCRMSIPSLG